MVAFSGLNILQNIAVRRSTPRTTSKFVGPRIVRFTSSDELTGLSSGWNCGTKIRRLILALAMNCSYDLMSFLFDRDAFIRARMSRSWSSSVMRRTVSGVRMDIVGFG